MTISSTSRKAGPYAGNGVTVSFPFSFKVFSTSDLLVTEIDSDDNEETLALTTNYTVALNADQNATPGGTITLPDALPVGNSLTIRTNIPITQTMDLTNQGGFYPTVINNAMDRATIQIQQLAEIVGRSPAVSIGSGLSGITIESPGAGEYLRWNLAGTAIEATAAVYDLGTFMQSGTGAVERSAMSKMGERVSVKDFGAEGNGVADDSAAFALLEAAYPGHHVDLDGFAYSVAAIPTGARYHNGSFVVGSVKTAMRAKRLDNPMDGSSRVAIGDGAMHYWSASAVYNPADGVMIAFLDAGYRHDTSESSPLNIMFSEDRGASWVGEKTIYSVDGCDVADAKAGVMGSGRIGALVSMRGGAISTYRNDFVYSDDDGATWDAIVGVIADGSGSFVYGDMLPYPAAVGGHDTTGFVVYSYTGGIIYALTTINNGATWSSSAVTSSASYTEASVVRVNNENKWLMFIRTGANLFVSTSVNMTTWTTPVDSGIAILSNPVYAYITGGRLFVYVFLRDFAPTALGVENEIILFEDDPAAVYAASDLVSKAYRVVVDGVDRALGYLKIMPVGNDHVWIYTAGEYDGSTLFPAATSIVTGSTRRSPGVGKTYADALASNTNIVRNGTFDFWSRGTSFTGFTANTNTADGWKFQPSGATVTVTQRALTPAESLLFPFHPQFGMEISATADNSSALVQQWFGTSEMTMIADSYVSIQVWGIGDVPSAGLRAGIQFDYGGGGSALAPTAALMEFAESADNVWKTTAVLRAPTMVGKTIGTDPKTIFVLGNSSETEAWDATIVGVKYELSSAPSRFRPIDLSAEKMRCQRYVQAIPYDSIDAVGVACAASTVAAFATIEYPAMVSAPSVSLLSGAAGSFEVYPLGSTITAVSASSVGVKATAISITTTGMTAGDSYLFRTKAASPVVFLLDAE